MKYNIKTIVFAILCAIIVGCIFMICTMLKFEHLERELAIQRTDLYAVRLVQTVLLGQHGIKLEISQPVHDLQEQKNTEANK